MSDKYKRAFSGRIHRGALKTHFKGPKPVRIQNETDKEYSNRIALNEWAIPPVSTFEKWRDNLNNQPIWDRHNGVQYGIVKSLYVDYKSLDVYMNANLSDEGLELAKKYGGLSIGYSIHEDKEGDDKFQFVEVSLTPNPRIKGCVVTGIKNGEDDTISETITVHLNVDMQEEKNKNKNMSEIKEEVQTPKQESLPVDQTSKKRTREELLKELSEFDDDVVVGEGVTKKVKLDQLLYFAKSNVQKILKENEDIYNKLKESNLVSSDEKEKDSIMEGIVKQPDLYKSMLSLKESLEKERIEKEELKKREESSKLEIELHKKKLEESQKLLDAKSKDNGMSENLKRQFGIKTETVKITNENDVPLKKKDWIDSIFNQGDYQQLSSQRNTELYNIANRNKF